MTENEDRLAAIIRRLRDHIFLAEVHRNPPERTWETEEECFLREKSNREYRQKWDEETDGMIREAAPQVT